METSKTEPIKHIFRSRGLNLCAFEWKGDSPPILLVHATGFHARCWDQVIKHLTGKQVFAIDLMGHGRSDKPPLPINWKQYTDNVIDFVKIFNLKHIIGVGHSMGGYLLTAAAATLDDRFSGLVLIDPVIVAPTFMPYGDITPEQMPVARRRNIFESPEEMTTTLVKKGSFNLWDPSALRDYCVYGLLPRKEGTGYELACPPLIEAATYLRAFGGVGIYEKIKKITIPVDIIRARDKTPEDPPFSFGYSPTYPQLASLFQKGTDIHLKEISHFIPMQDPKLTADYILDMVKRCQ